MATQRIIIFLNYRGACSGLGARVFGYDTTTSLHTMLGYFLGLLCKETQE
jgi:hypothetical protein